MKRYLLFWAGSNQVECCRFEGAPDACISCGMTKRRQLRDNVSRYQKELRGKEDSPENLELAGLQNKTISNPQLFHSIKDS